jgi:Glycosyltransferase family 87
MVLRPRYTSPLSGAHPVFFTPKRLKLYLGALLVIQIFTILSGLAILRTPRGRYIDLRTFYTAGYMLRTHQASLLYDYATEQRLQTVIVSPDPRALPLMSPPFTALLFVPLTHVSFGCAHAVLAGINILLLAACITLLQPFLSTLSARWKPAPAFLFLSFLPACVATLMGQLSVMLLLIYCAGFICLWGNHNLLAGLILSLAIMKFQVAIPIAILFFLWRQWRFTAGFIAGSVLLTALSIRIVGLAPFFAYLHSLYSMTSAVSAQRSIQLQYANLPEQMPNLYGLLFTVTRGAPWSRILILTLSVALFLWTAHQRPSLPLALSAAMLVSYHLFFYDLTLLLLPLSLLTDHLLRSPEPTHPRGLRLLTTKISVCVLLLTPFIRLFTSSNETCWLALPILALTLASPWWPALHGQADPALADAALDRAPAV